MAFSDRALLTINEFARNIGLRAVPAFDGSFSFVFEQSGTLTLTSDSDGERMLASLYLRPAHLNPEMESRLLRLAGPDVTTGRFLSTGSTRDGDAIFVTGIDADEMSLPVLETCIQQLMAASRTFTAQT